jgi:hypothetical protein
MKFGNLYWQQAPDRSYSVAKRIWEEIDLAVPGEGHGFRQMRFTEQRFHNHGYPPSEAADV